MLNFIFSILVIFYIWNPQTFERYFFLNEVLSAYGAFVFYMNRAFFLKNHIVKAALPFVFLVLIFWLVSLLRYDNFYVYLRRLSLFYSFFVIFSFYNLFVYVEKSKMKWLWFFAVQKVNLLFSYMYLAASLTKNMVAFWLMSALFIISYTIIFGGSTGIFSFFTTILIFSTSRMLKFFLSFFISMFVILTYLVLYQDYFGESLYLQDVYEFMNMYEVLAIDGNITVRLFMWKEIIFDILPSTYFVGIGFGTILFEQNFIHFIGLRTQLINDEFLPYTLSPHNSFIYIVATMGIPGIAAVFYMYKKLISNYRHRYIRGFSTYKERQIFIIFIAYSIAAAMNVVIESPIHSGLYWGILGIYLLEQKRSDSRSIN